MQKDTTQKQLEAYNDVFVDIYNVAIPVGCADITTGRDVLFYLGFG